MAGIRQNLLNLFAMWVRRGECVCVCMGEICCIRMSHDMSKPHMHPYIYIYAMYIYRYIQYCLANNSHDSRFLMLRFESVTHFTKAEAID